MQSNFVVNERCLVRHLDCKRIFSGSRICFIACPNSEEISLELEIIKQKLREVNIEPYVAVDNRDFQKDIFCEKICTKIIESQFCIVVLNDVIDIEDNVRKPNANVYYEYGIMTAFRKKIVPIQLKSQKLAFNIQSLDTLKYDKGNFGKSIEEAIKVVLLEIEGDNEKKKEDFTINSDWVLDIMGLVLVDGRFGFRHERTLALRSLGFKPYNKSSEGKLFLVGIFTDDIPDKDVVLRCKIATIRIKNYCDQLQSEIKEIADETRPSRMIEEKISEYRSSINLLSNATLLIIKDGLENKDGFTEAYNDSVHDIGLKLDIKVLDDTQIAELLK